MLLLRIVGPYTGYPESHGCPQLFGFQCFKLRHNRLIPYPCQSAVHRVARSLGAVWCASCIPPWNIPHVNKQAGVNSQYSCFLWTLSKYPRQVCPPVADLEEGDQSDLLYVCLADSFPLGVTFSEGILKLQTWNSGKWDIACIFTACTVNVLVVCCGVNDSQLHFWSGGWWEKRKPKQGTAVIQIFTEAKRAV